MALIVSSPAAGIPFPSRVDSAAGLSKTCKRPRPPITEMSIGDMVWVAGLYIFGVPTMDGF